MMSEDTDYSDGKEQAAVADKAFQNKDVLKWMDRLERAKKFVDSAETVVSALETVLSEVPKRSFVSAWLNGTKDKSAPRSVVADVNVMPPSIKKIHKDDKDKSFVRYKEYPFYYILPVTAMFTVCPSSPESVPDSVETAEWFSRSIDPAVSKEVLDKAKVELERKFSNLFHFPSDKDDFEEGKINVVCTSSLRITLASSSRPRSAIMPFKDSSDYREMLVNEISIAIGRCIPPPSGN